MTVRTGVVLSMFGFVVALSVLVLGASPAVAQGYKKARVCIDTETNTVRLRRKCVEPRYTEVTPAQLTAPTITLVNESHSISLSSTDDTEGHALLCPEGTFVTGGGASVVDNLGLNMKTSIPRLGLDGWSASVSALRNNASGKLNIYAICSTGITVVKEDSSSN